MTSTKRQNNRRGGGKPAVKTLTVKSTGNAVRGAASRRSPQRAELSPAALQQAAECLRTLAHPHRLQMVQLLLSGQPFTVGELALRCGISQPQTSDHLRLMQRCHFLNAVRQGRAVYYEIAEPHLEKIMACIENRFGAGGG